MLDPELADPPRPLVYASDFVDVVAGDVLSNALAEERENPFVGGVETRQPGDDIEPAERRWIRRRVLNWFDAHGREFPWRERPEPYRVLIAELLLQRTRADLVLARYEDFVSRFPDPWRLAAADADEVKDCLHPLGFAHRNARLPVLARELCDRHDGEVPQSKQDLLALTGVGEYVANAVLAVAFGERRPLLDPNVIRLVDRATAHRSQRVRPREDRALWNLIAELLPRDRAPEFALALVDLGAVICRPKRPRCFGCPLRGRCVAFANGDVSPAPLSEKGI
jgi:A/G-specific adenine glycosylase